MPGSNVSDQQLVDHDVEGLPGVEAVCQILMAVPNDNQLAPHDTQRMKLVGGVDSRCFYYREHMPEESRIDKYVRGWLLKGITSAERDLTEGTVTYAFALIQRLVSDYDLVVCQQNVHRLMLTAMLLASKWLDDTPNNNRFWANVGGIKHEELDDQEQRMLMMLKYTLFIPDRLNLGSGLETTSDRSGRADTGEAELEGTAITA